MRLGGERNTLSICRGQSLPQAGVATEAQSARVSESSLLLLSGLPLILGVTAKHDTHSLVPTLEYDGKPLYESNVICEFLEEGRQT